MTEVGMLYYLKHNILLYFVHNRKRVDSKHAELSKLSKHAKFILYFSSINYFNNN